MALTPGRWRKARLPLFFVASLLLGLSLPGVVSAHPLPSARILLDVNETNIQGELHISIPDIEATLSAKMSTNTAQQFQAYLREHLHATTQDKSWTIQVHNAATGINTISHQQEVVANLTFTPPTGMQTRVFELTYDGPSPMLVAIRQDWANGIIPASPASVGVIGGNSATSNTLPVMVNLSEGNWWKGFLGMIMLGMSHIRDGTDHLLFLLTLLLPAPLLAARGRWQTFAGKRRAILTIIEITAAFTVGHSLTLVLGALLHIAIPSQPIEALIALSIIVSAAHALRPLFPSKEMLIAGGFGLIHGMAFSFTLAELHLDTGQMALSLLGFNVGIETMQLIIVAVTMPSLVILAQTGAYRYIRIGGASLALVAALGWLGQRLGYANVLGALADGLGSYAGFIILGLGLAAFIALLAKQVKSAQPAPK